RACSRPVWQPLRDLLDLADLVTLHAPLNADPRHLINQHSLQHLQGKFLINTARGALIDPDALESAMQRRQLRGLGLDVHADETRLPAAGRRGRVVAVRLQGVRESVAGGPMGRGARG
ncbi:hypothetical protein EWW49_27955, partial [Pseudomonas syringae]